MPTPLDGRIETHREGGVLELRITNPSRANALDRGMLERLVAILSSDALEGVRAVLLGGDGERHFSSGLDLRGDGVEVLEESLRGGERLLGHAADAIADCPVPVIGVLGGTAAGGALELAIACDWRIASPEARLAMPAARRLGVVYTAEGVARFVAVMGPARTRMLFLTGRPVDGHRAFEIGLVDEVVDEPAGLWDAARAAAGAIAEAAPIAVAGTRAIIAALPRGGAGEVARTWRRRAFASADLREGLAAFSERRAPRFEGG